MTHLRALVRDTRGAAAAEMALVLPLLLVLMFGGFEAGHYFYTEQKVIKAVREGARYAGRLPFSSYDCAANTIGREADIKAVTRTGKADWTGTNRIAGFEDADITVELSCNTDFDAGLYAKLGQAPQVRVSAAVDYPSLFGTLGFDTDGAKVYAGAQAAVMGQ